MGTKPDYYRVYLASASDSRTWFGMGEATSGLAIATGPLHADVVLRHELAHVVSIYGSAGSSWWLVVGYATNTHHGLSLNPAPVTRSLIHDEWDSTLPELPQPITPKSARSTPSTTLLP